MAAEEILVNGMEDSVRNGQNTSREIFLLEGRPNNSVDGRENIDPSDMNIVRFDTELEGRSKSWVYDWILDLGDSENSNCTSGSQWHSCVTVRSRGFEHPSIIREELQFLQTKMV